MRYNCLTCNYETYDFGNFSRHKNSKKHKNNESKIDINAAEMQPAFNQSAAGCDIKKSDNVSVCFNKSNEQNSYSFAFICDHCGSKFKHHQSMYRHVKYRCQLKNDDTSKVKLLEEKNKTLEKQNEKLINIATDNAGVAKKSMSVMSYALTHFNDAPPIKLLEDDQFNKISNLLMYDDNGKKKTEKSIEEVILFHHKQGTLSRILGELIVKVYKKNNPKNQSTWSSDVARLTFIIKDVIGKSKKSKWVVDKKGVHFTETIINPLTEKIKELLMNYNDKCGKYVKKMSKKSMLNDFEESKIKNSLSQMQEANLTLLTIKLRKIHIEILKYVAPYFNLNINTIDDHKCDNDFILSKN
jgi:hypothetical protein